MSTFSKNMNCFAYVHVIRKWIDVTLLSKNDDEWSIHCAHYPNLELYALEKDLITIPANRKYFVIITIKPGAYRTELNSSTQLFSDLSYDDMKQMVNHHASEIADDYHSRVSFKAGYLVDNFKKMRIDV